MSSRHNSHTLGFRFKVRVPQKSPNKPGSIIGTDVEQNQTIRWMDEVSFEEISILRKERNSPVLMHQWDYL
jgi:hypothetical protein